MWQDARHQELCQSLEAYNDQIAKYQRRESEYGIFGPGRNGVDPRERPQDFIAGRQNW